MTVLEYRILAMHQGISGTRAQDSHSCVFVGQREQFELLCRLRLRTTCGSLPCHAWLHVPACSRHIHPCLSSKGATHFLHQGA